MRCPCRLIPCFVFVTRICGIGIYSRTVGYPRKGPTGPTGKKADGAGMKPSVRFDFACLQVGLLLQGGISDGRFRSHLGGINRYSVPRFQSGWEWTPEAKASQLKVEAEVRNM